MELLRTVWHTWKRIGQAIGDVTARILLTIFYFTIFMPFGVAVRLLSDPLELKQRYSARWLDRSTEDRVLDDGRRLF